MRVFVIFQPLIWKGSNSPCLWYLFPQDEPAMPTSDSCLLHGKPHPKNAVPGRVFFVEKSPGKKTSNLDVQLEVRIKWLGFQWVI